MTERQRRFVDEYLVDGNIDQAAIRAGYSPKTARTSAHKFLANPSIREAINKRIAEKNKELIADQDEILQYLTSVMRGAHETEFVYISQGEAFRDSKTPDEKERIKAAEILAKRYGLDRPADESIVTKLQEVIDKIDGSMDE